MIKKKRRPRDKINKHMQEYWDEELPQIQACIRETNVLSSHILKRLEERNISIVDLATALLSGKIIEGFDVGTYPGYRNPSIFRTILGRDTSNREMKIGVAIDFFKGSNKLFVVKLTTAYYIDSADEKGDFDIA